MDDVDHEHAFDLAMRRPVLGDVGTMSVEAQKLLVVTYHFGADGPVGGHRWAALTKYLGTHGWKSWVVACGPTGSVEQVGSLNIHRHARLPTVRDLYRRFRTRSATVSNRQQQQPRDGVVQRQTGLLEALRLEASILLALPDMSRGWILRAAMKCRRLVRAVRPDVVVSSGPPHAAHLAAWLGVLGSQTPHVMDLRDPWAGPVSDAWVNKPIHRSLIGRASFAHMERLCTRSAAGLWCTTNELAEVLSARYPSTRVRWVPNSFDLAQLPSRRQPRRPGLSMVYAGSLYAGRSLSPVLEALSKITRSDYTQAGNHITLDVIGQREPDEWASLRAEINRLGLETVVKLRDALPRQAVLDYLQRAHFGIVLAPDQPHQVPAKLYEVCATAERALVVAPRASATGREALRLGADVVEPQDAQAVEEILETARRRRGSAVQMDTGGYERVAALADEELRAVCHSTGRQRGGTVLT